MFKIGKDNVRAHVGSVEYHFYISGPIVEDDDYVELIDTLYQGRDTDNIVIHLNTPGGNLDITMQIINAIRSSSATVIGVADGPVASAGSLILFSCPNIAVQKFSYVMLHDGSEGSMGKVNENFQQAMFSVKLLRSVYHEVYSGFFTEEEIDKVLEGRDMWLTSEEVEERITKLKEENEQTQL